MSTKIYNGYKIADQELSLSQINTLLNPARLAMVQAAELSLFQSKVTSACALLDRRVLRQAGFELPLDEKNESPSRSCLSSASSSLNDGIEEDRRAHRRNHKDPEANLCVFSDNSGTYALLYAESKEIQGAFETALGCSEYNYWNNTDEPEGMEIEEWNQRGKRWDDLLGSTGVPAALGASFELVSPSLIWLSSPLPATALGVESDDSLLPVALVGSVEDRAYRLALTQPQSAPSEEVKNSRGTSEYIRHLSSLRKGEVPEFNEVRDRIAALLPASYSLAALREDEATTALRFAHVAPPSSRRVAP